MKQSYLNNEVIKMRVQVCKAMANPTRMRIIDALKDGEKTAGDLACILDIPAATLSQHLSILRNVGVLESRREVKYIIYRLSDLRIIEACNLMSEVLLDRIKQMEKLSKSLRKEQHLLKEREHETERKS